jgi:cephalosporin hydroxylase
MTSAIPYPLLVSVQQGTMQYRYRGVPMLKNPFDLAIYPLLLAHARPRSLIEIGSHRGGSAIWFADVAANLGLPLHVHSIDRTVVNDVAHSAVTFLEGDARDLGRILTDDVIAALPRPLLVVEDADHHFDTCLAVLSFFDLRLFPGEYIVIEDGILLDMLAADGYAGGPARAIAAFLAGSGGRYAIDRAFCDYFGRNVTWNVDGYLRRI